MSTEIKESYNNTRDRAKKSETIPIGSVPIDRKGAMKIEMAHNDTVDATKTVHSPLWFLKRCFTR